jgi:hypothetical protein
LVGFKHAIYFGVAMGIAFANAAILFENCSEQDGNRWVISGDDGTNHIGAVGQLGVA